MTGVTKLEDKLDTLESQSDVTKKGASKMKGLFVHFARDESGVTAIEYGLIAAGIGVAIITVVNSVGTSLNTLFGRVATDLSGAAGG